MLHAGLCAIFISTNIRKKKGLGEGWSDAVDFIFLHKAGSLRSNAYPIGAYATGMSNGVRTYPYSSNTNINPHVWSDIRLLDESHLQGSVWTVMLWVPKILQKLKI